MSLFVGHNMQNQSESTSIQINQSPNTESSDTSNSQGTGANIQLHVEVKTHPDGGWGWVICLGAFFVQFIALGMQNSAGIVYTALVDEFKSQRGATGRC